MRKFVGDTVLTSPVWNWGTYYVATVQDMLDGKWTTHQYWGGMKEGVVGLADLSPKVPQDVRDLVEKEKQKILKGEWDVFWGPIKDQTGKERFTASQKMTDQEILNMDWFIEGVVGTIPKQ